MIKAILCDFSRVLLFPIDSGYTGSLNGLYQDMKSKPPFHFEHHFRLNTDLILYLKTLRKTDKYLLTTDRVQNDSAVLPTLLSTFRSIFTASALGYLKNDPEIYTTVLTQIQREPTEVLFIDDTLENIEAAKSAGLHTLVYHSTDQVKAAFKALLV